MPCVLRERYINLPRRLIINADDYGACREVNAAIEQLASAGLLGGASVLANGGLWLEAATFLRNHPELSAGVHFNAIEGRPVSDAPGTSAITGEDGSFVGLGALLRRWMLRPIAVSRAVEREWRAQVERLKRVGVRLTHADSHQHLHAFPPAYRCVVRLCREYRIPALRYPREWGAPRERRAESFLLHASLGLSRLVTPRSALFHNDHFLGLQRNGGYRLAELVQALRIMPDGLTEIALHPSTKDGVPYPSLCGDRERQALLDNSFLAEIECLGIERWSWERVTQ